MGVDVGAEDERARGAVELEAAAVAHGHAREPDALGLEAGRGVGAEVDADADLVAVAADGDAGLPPPVLGSPLMPRRTWSMRRSSDSSPKTVVPSPISICTRASGATSQTRAARSILPRRPRVVVCPCSDASMFTASSRRFNVLSTPPLPSSMISGGGAVSSPAGSPRLGGAFARRCALPARGARSAHFRVSRSEVTGVHPARVELRC